MLERCKDCKDYGRVVVECCFFVSMVLECSWNVLDIGRKSDEVG